MPRGRPQRACASPLLLATGRRRSCAAYPNALAPPYLLATDRLGSRVPRDRRPGVPRGRPSAPAPSCLLATDLRARKALSDSRAVIPVGPEEGKRVRSRAERGRSSAQRLSDGDAAE